MWLPWGRAATRGRPYTNSQVVECTNVMWSDLANEPIAVGLLMGTRRLESYCQFFALGQTLRIHVMHVWGKHELMRFRCTITSATTGTLLQHAELNVFKPKALQAYLQEVGHDNSRAHQRR